MHAARGGGRGGLKKHVEFDRQGQPFGAHEIDFKRKMLNNCAIEGNSERGRIASGKFRNVLVALMCEFKSNYIF